MYTLLLTIHILVCVTLMIVVLVQSSKVSGMGGVFGGGSNDALLSAPSGNLFLRKVTIGLALAFASTTLLLTALHSRQATHSVIQRVPVGNR